MIKILIISPDILPVPAVKGGAVETLIQQLIESKVKNNTDPQISYTVVSIKDEKICENSDDSYIYINNNFIKKTTSRVFGKISRLFSVSRSYTNIYLREVSDLVDDYDYIVVENQPEYALPLRKKTKAKFILHLHNDKINVNTQFLEKISESFDYVFSVSDYVRKQVEKTSFFKSSQLKVLYNCVDVERYATKLSVTEREQIRNKYSVEKNAKIILYVGRIDATKGVLELVQAFNRLNHNVVLVIVGSVWFSDNRKNQFVRQLETETSGAKKSIVFTGYVDHKEISYLQQASDIIVVPSVCEDACPLVVLESMASYTPIIATDSGGIPELISNGCGVLVPRNSNNGTLIDNLQLAFENLLSNEGKGQLLAHNAWEKVQEFHINNYAKNFDKLIRDIDDEK